MPNCDNCSSSSAKYQLCEECYMNIFKSLYCDGRCGRSCDPSKRTGKNILASPNWWYCEFCRKKREMPNMPIETKKEFNTSDIEKMKKKLEELKIIEKEWEVKNKDWNEKNKRNEIMLEGTSGRFHKVRKQLQNFYDIIVDIDSLKNIVKGWKIKFTEEGKKNYEVMKNEEKLIVGVVGNRNRGKSFVLSKLSNEILPDGSSIKTEGISIKYPRMVEGKKAEYILMDSAGFENALLETDDFKQEQGMEKEKALINLKDIASDKTLTEYFLQNFIIQKSNILMIVLGILSYNEQKLLNRIKTENRKKQGNPHLYVIHNLQTFSLKEQVQDYIEETLLKSATFKLKEIKYVKAGQNISGEETSNYKYYIEEFYNKDDKTTVVNHLILAMHGSEAGDYYNQFVYDFLSEQFNANPVHEKFPVIEAVKQQCIESSKNIMVEPIDSLKDFEDSEDVIKLKTLSDDDKERTLSFKRCLIDELGFSNFYGTNFEPKYSCYKTIVNKKPYVCVKVEIPGESKYKCKAEISENYWNISVNGNKTIDKSEDIEPKTSINNREEGKFSLNIKLDSTEFQLKEKRPEKDLTKSIEGLRCFYFPLIANDESESEPDD